MKTSFKRKIVFGIPTALLAIAVLLTPIINNQAQNNIGQINSVNNQQLQSESNNDSLEYIRNDVALQTDDISTIQEIRLADLALNAEHSAAVVVKKDGSTLLYMWGSNTSKQLGPIVNKMEFWIKNPERVHFDFPFPIKQVALGFEHSVVLLENGSIYAWGSNGWGQLGIGYQEQEHFVEPQLVAPLDRVKQIAVGKWHTGALIENGDVYTWGINDYGQLGIDDKTLFRHDPKKITLNKVKMLQFQDSYSGAVNNDGVVYMWGDNSPNKLGGGEGLAPKEYAPIKITIPGLSTPNEIKQLSLGLNHSTVLLNDNRLFVWGDNTYGQLGIGESFAKTPTELKFNFDSPIKQISLGQDFSVVLLNDGNVYTWGNHEYGRLGLGADINQPQRTPKLVTFPSLGINKVVQIATTRYVTIAILDDSRWYGWGWSNNSQLPTIEAQMWSPIYITAFGKDSHLRANSTLTALEAVNKMWVNNTTNSAGFLKSLELINIPQINSQSYTLKQAPLFDNYTGEVTIEVKIKYFYNQDGLLVADTSTLPMTISGFMPAVIKNSMLITKTVYPSPSAYQLTPTQLATQLTQANAIDLPVMLNNYLDIDLKTQDEGQTAKIKAVSIDSANINNNKGTLQINLSLENYYENGKELTTKSLVIPYLRKISSFSVKDNYESATGSLTSGQFISQIDALSTSAEYKTMLSDYFSINLANQDTTNTPNAVISDVTATENSNGVVQVEIYFTNFYDSNSQLLPKLSFVLNGFIKTSTVDFKEGYEAFAATTTPYAFIDEINAVSTSDQYKQILSPFLDLTLNTDVVIDSVTPTSTELEHDDGKLELTLELQNYYEANGLVRTKNFNFEGFIKKVTDDEVIPPGGGGVIPPEDGGAIPPDNDEIITNDQQAGLDWWIYLIIAGGGAAIIGLAVWLIIKKTRNSAGGLNLKF